MARIEFLPCFNRRCAEGAFGKTFKVKTGMPELNRAKKVILLVLVMFIIGSAQGIRRRSSDWIRERPESPEFPMKSLRIKALGEDFLGIVSDVETDVMFNPSLLPQLESNQIGIFFSPDYRYKNIVGLNLLLPKIFNSKIGLGFYNQLKFYNPEYYQYFYPDYYYNSYFGSYQQSVFVSFQPVASFAFASFYTLVKSPYHLEQESFSENYYDYIDDSLNFYHRKSGYEYDDDITEHRFGIGAVLKLKRNLLQLTVSFKNEKNVIDFTDEYQRHWLHTYFGSYAYDSSYNYYFRQYSDSTWDKYVENKKRTGEEQRLDFRWQRDLNGWLGFTMNLRRFSSDLTGQRFDTSYSELWQYYFERWRNYPNPESTEITDDTSHDYYRGFLEVTGKAEGVEGSIASGFKLTISEFINCFIGLKSVITLNKDSIQEIGNEIKATDTSRYEYPLSFYQVQKSDRIIISIPIGLEYQISSPVCIRTGISPRFYFERMRYKTEKREYPDFNSQELSFNYSFGLGFKLTPKLSVDLYNKGQLFSLGEWFVQGRYRF